MGLAEESVKPQVGVVGWAGRLGWFVGVGLVGVVGWGGLLGWIVGVGLFGVGWLGVVGVVGWGALGLWVGGLEAIPAPSCKLEESQLNQNC